VSGDPIRPAHYLSSGLEPITAIEAWGLGFNLGNSVKYIARAGKKGDALEDLKKAAWYLQREIDGNGAQQEAERKIDLWTEAARDAEEQLASDIAYDNEHLDSANDEDSARVVPEGVPYDKFLADVEREKEEARAYMRKKLTGGATQALLTFKTPTAEIIASASVADFEPKSIAITTTEAEVLRAWQVRRGYTETPQAQEIRRTNVHTFREGWQG
jgi:hypothetical protein